MLPRPSTRRSKKKSRKWKPDERLKLLEGVGAYGWVWFNKKFKRRSQNSLRMKLRREVGSASFVRGASTLARLMRDTGYARSQLMRARSALGQKWHRLQEGGVYLISDEQRDDLCNWLSHDYWSPLHRRYSCCWCAAADTPPYCAGFCKRCFWRYRRLCVKIRIPYRLSHQRIVVAFLSRWLTDDFLLQQMSDRLERNVGLERPWLLGLAIRVREYERRVCQPRRRGQAAAGAGCE